MSAPCPVFAFTVELVLHPEVQDAVKAELAKTFHEEFLDARGLIATRVAGIGLAFVVQSEASQATDADVRAVEAWARPRREIIRARVGPIVDLDTGE